MAIADEVNDVLMLSRIVNTDAQHVKTSMLSDNKSLPKLVNPANAIKGLIPTNSEQPPTIPQELPPLPTITGPQGEQFVIPPSRPLIPLPANYQIPTPQSQTLPTQPVVKIGGSTPALPVPIPPAPSPQLELPLSYEKQTEFQNLQDYFDAKIKQLDVKFDIINAKLNELLSRKRGPYGPRKTNSSNN